MQHQEESYYVRYCRMGRRFEIIGGIIAGAALLIGWATGLLGHPVILLPMWGGMLCLLFGVINMRPNNQIKSFAMQLQATCDRDFAQGLLEAMTGNGKTALSGRSRTILAQAIAAYAQSEGADEEMAESLRAAMDKHIRPALF